VLELSWRPASLDRNKLRNLQLAILAVMASTAIDQEASHRVDLVSATEDSQIVHPDAYIGNCISDKDV
jgi:hypothetical protein